MNRRQVLCSAGAVLGAEVGSRGVFRAERVGLNLQRFSRSLAGETVNIRDYCAADGRRINTQSYQELIDRQPAIIIYPSDTRLILDGPIKLGSNQVHQFNSGAVIEAESKDFALQGVGLTGQHLASLAAPVARYNRRLDLEKGLEAASGDIILLADVTQPNDIRIDVNVVDRVEGNVAYTRYPIGRSFAADSSFRLYKIGDPIRNLRFEGGVHLLNRHPKGGGLRLTHAVDVKLSGLTVGDAGYIGIALEGSLRAQLRDIRIDGSGASGLGIRASKDILIDNFRARGVRGDESLTFYDNVSQVIASHIDIEQYIFQERPAGYGAGNDILIDQLCSRIALGKVTCVGSATYNVMINDRSDNCSLTDFVIRRSNLGGVRISAGCNDTVIDRGVISDVLDAYDREGNKPVSAISVGTTCRSTQIGKDVRYERVASHRQVAELRDVGSQPKSR